LIDSILRIVCLIGFNIFLASVHLGAQQSNENHNVSDVSKASLLEDFPLINYLNRDDWIKDKSDHYKEISDMIGLDATIEDSEIEDKVVKSMNSQWQEFRDIVMQKLNSDIFKGWPSANKDLKIEKFYESDLKNVRFSVIKFNGQRSFKFPVYLVHRKGINVEDLDLVVLNVLDEKGWSDFISTYGKVFPKAFDSNINVDSHDGESFESNRRMFQNQDWGMAYFSPRAIGAMASLEESSSKDLISKRLNLLGESLEGMQVFDIIQSVNALRMIEGMKSVSLWMQSHDNMAVNLLYASLYVNNIKRLDLHGLPESHIKGPTYIGIMNYIDVPQCLALAVERTRIVLYQSDASYNPFAENVIDALNFNSKSLSIRKALEFD
tara:strand:- start:282 stop:1418 length:1137 start_codon:yes stop_codon:yes gene_type:complete